MDRSKIGRSSKRKGKAYESRIAKLLNEFTNIGFRRVPMSGGFNKFGGVVIAEHVFTGDVLCDRDDFLYSVEAKNRKDISLTATLKNPHTSSLTKYWYQCCEDAENHNLKPMMFFKPNTTDDWVCLSVNDAKSLALENAKHLVLNIYHEEIDLKVTKRDDRGKKMTVNLEKVKLPNMFILDWKEFIKSVDPRCLFREN